MTIRLRLKFIVLVCFFTTSPWTYAQVLIHGLGPVPPAPPQASPSVTSPQTPASPVTDSTANDAAQAHNQEMMALISALGGMGGGAGGKGGSGSGFSPQQDVGPSFFQQNQDNGDRVVEPSDSYSGGSGSVSGSGSSSGAGLRSTGCEDLKGNQPIVPVFKKYCGSCMRKAGLGNCIFLNMGIMGDAAHQARRSCHNTGEAIDVGPLTCDGGKKVDTMSAAFYEVAKCMAHDTNGELGVIYYKSEPPNMIQKSDHSNHMHIQLKNCMSHQR